MTNYPYTHGPNDTLDEAYTRWLDKNGFPALQQLLADQECEDVAVLRSVPNREPLGRRLRPRRLPAKKAGLAILGVYITKGR